MRATILIVSAATLLLPTATAAQAVPQQSIPQGTMQDGPGSVGYGRRLAEEICGECHRVTAGKPAKPPPMEEDTGAPDLTERMTDPGMTEMALRSYLRTSHPLMPNIRLTPDETDDILAYLMTLKRGAQ